MIGNGSAHTLLGRLGALQAQIELALARDQTLPGDRPQDSSLASSCADPMCSISRALARGTAVHSSTGTAVRRSADAGG
jgi:hypothetical protein